MRQKGALSQNIFSRWECEPRHQRPERSTPRRPRARAAKDGPLGFAQANLRKRSSKQDACISAGCRPRSIQCGLAFGSLSKNAPQ